MPDIDTGLFDRACRGDRDAFWDLVVPHRGLIFAVALGMVRNRERAEDHVHEVLVKASQSLPSLRDPQKLPAWLYSLTRHHIMDAARREKRLRRAMQRPEALMAPVVPVSELMEKERWLERMERAIPALPEPFRVILGMKYMNDYSCRDIAEILDVSVPAVKSRLFEARKLLRRRMQELAAEQGGRNSEMQ